MTGGHCPQCEDGNMCKMVRCQASGLIGGSSSHLPPALSDGDHAKAVGLEQLGHPQSHVSNGDDSHGCCTHDDHERGVSNLK